ncbi:hypothetical protein CYMTET_37108 [Cymbomonas tetramitiformis]|uniref:Uncharacterized protein n=1 Tax=Cymbomonas tetramitiformis TaxID=36881 RepID=A0AAE0CEM1_9CHLO|nr:hypothetical protein CYMTET_37108 [Cymbomonas tetramitiformis]
MSYGSEEAPDELILADSGLHRFPNLQSYAHLQKLVVSHNRILKIEGLEAVPLLRDLRMEHNRVAKLDGVSSLHYLRSLNAAHNSLVRLDGLEKCDSLQLVNFHNNVLSSTDGLQRLTSLTSVDLSHNNLASLPVVALSPKLVHLDVSHNLIGTLQSAPSSLPSSLQALFIANNELEDILELKYMTGCVRLMELEIKGNSCISVASEVGFDHRPLVGFLLPRLRRLDGEAVKEAAWSKSCNRLFCDNRGLLSEQLLQLLDGSSSAQLVAYLRHQCPAKEPKPREIADADRGKRAAAAPSSREGGRGGLMSASSSFLLPGPGRTAASARPSSRTHASERGSARADLRPQGGSALHFDRAALLIQRVARGFLTRRRQAMYVERHRAAVLLQAQWRGYHVRRADVMGICAYMRRRASHTTAASRNGSAAVGGVVHGGKAGKDMIHDSGGQIQGLKESVKDLTGQVQGLMARLDKTEESRAVLESALRCVWDENANLRMWRATVEAKEQRRAATLIQRRWRGWRCRHVYTVIRMKRARDKAHRQRKAVTIQRFARGWLCRRRLPLQMQAERENEALKAKALRFAKWRRSVDKAAHSRQIHQLQSDMLCASTEMAAMRKELHDMRRYVIRIAAGAGTSQPPTAQDLQNPSVQQLVLEEPTAMAFRSPPPGPSQHSGNSSPTATPRSKAPSSYATMNRRPSLTSTASSKSGAVPSTRNPLGPPPNTAVQWQR